MRRALLRNHASGPSRFSLATPPARSGVLHDGEKITIRVAEPDDLRARGGDNYAVIVDLPLSGSARTSPWNLSASVNRDVQIIVCSREDARSTVSSESNIRCLRSIPTAPGWVIKCTLPP